ncbi:hypothetical protein [Streptomyces chiangmaiensis]|uniref:Uncharacterized protein n=1 Tax=Streptomyces chiangmaiensis TaxID=766497 RepID=A0ABU7FXD4_9ACTN|nr:hypothetical protein [Streptomyces chiangmaiensis]MED7828600.1 hypothetical protein [Streptomyces chiangmaiensis]
MTTAFDPIVLDGNPAERAVMAPMNRSRTSGPGAEPTELPATHRPREAAGITDDSRVETAIEAATAEAGRLDFSLSNVTDSGTFRTGEVHSTDVLNSVIALHVRDVFLSNGQHRGRAAADGLPDLWRPGRGQHRRPAVLNASGKQQ